MEDYLLSMSDSKWEIWNSNSVANISGWGEKHDYTTSCFQFVKSFYYYNKKPKWLALKHI